MFPALLRSRLHLILLRLALLLVREGVVHPPVSLELAQLLDRILQVDGHVPGLGRGIVAVADVDLAVTHLVITNHEAEVV